jgi:hypothetical protein
VTDALAAGELPPPGTVRRRRLGLLLATFGAVGILLVGTGFALVLGPVDPAQGPFGIEAQRRQLVAMLDQSGKAMDSAETAARDADGSLGQTATAAGSAATLMTDLARTMTSLASSLRISFLGTQPFAPAAADMDRVAAQAATVGTDLETAASSVRVAAEDMSALAAELGDMRTELTRIRTSLAGPVEIGPWRLLLIALLGWFAVPAAVSLWIGLHWLLPARARTARARSSPPTPAPPR